MLQPNDEFIDDGWDTLQLSGDEKIIVDQGMPVVVDADSYHRRPHHVQRRGSKKHRRHSSAVPQMAPAHNITPRVASTPLAVNHTAPGTPIPTSGLAPPPPPPHMSPAVANNVSQPYVAQQAPPKKVPAFFDWMGNIVESAQKLFGGQPEATAQHQTPVMPGSIPDTTHPAIKQSPLIQQATSPYMQQGPLPPYEQKPLPNQFAPPQNVSQPYSAYPQSAPPLTSLHTSLPQYSAPPSYSSQQYSAQPGLGAYGVYSAPMAAGPAYSQVSQYPPEPNYHAWLEKETEKEMKKKYKKKSKSQGVVPAGFDLNDDTDVEEEVVKNPDPISSQAPLLVLIVAIFAFILTHVGGSSATPPPPSSEAPVVQGASNILGTLRTGAIICFMALFVIIYFRYSPNGFGASNSRTPLTGKPLSEKDRGPFDFHTSQPYDFMAQFGADSMPFGPGHAYGGMPPYGAMPPMGAPIGGHGAYGSISGMAGGLPSSILGGMPRGMPGEGLPSAYPAVGGWAAGGTPQVGGIPVGGMPIGSMPLGGMPGQMYPNLYAHMDYEDSEEDTGEDEYVHDYLPSGSFEEKLVPSPYLKKKKKAAPSSATPVPFSVPDVSKDLLEEEQKPTFYEPMPPLPGIDDPTIEPILLRQLKQGPDSALLKEVERKKADTDKTEHAKGKKDERIEGTTKKAEEFYVDDFSCKPYGPPPRRYHGVNA